MKLVTAVAALLMLGACVSTTVTPLGVRQDLPAIAYLDVAVYRTAEQVPGPYREVALLDSFANANQTVTSQVYISMKMEAAKLGANAIIIDGTTEPSAGARVAGAIFGVGARRHGRAIAIYIEPPAPPAVD